MTNQGGDIDHEDGQMRLKALEVALIKYQDLLMQWKKTHPGKQPPLQWDGVEWFWVSRDMRRRVKKAL